MKSLNKELAHTGTKLFGTGTELTPDEVKDMKCKKCKSKGVDKDAVYFVNNMGEESLLCRECGDIKKSKWESIIASGMMFVKELEFEKKGKLYYIPVYESKVSETEHSVEGKFWYWQGHNKDLIMLTCDKTESKREENTIVPVSFDDFKEILPQMYYLASQTGTLMNQYFFAQDYPFDRPDTSCIYVLTNAECGCCDDTYGKMIPLREITCKEVIDQKDMWDKCDTIFISPKEHNFALKN